MELQLCTGEKVLVYRRAHSASEALRDQLLLFIIHSCFDIHISLASCCCLFCLSCITCLVCIYVLYFVPLYYRMNAHRQVAHSRLDWHFIEYVYQYHQYLLSSRILSSREISLLHGKFSCFLDKK